MTIRELIKISLEEDINFGDITTGGLGLGDEKVRARLVCKEKGVIAGLEIFRSVFSEIDSDVEITFVHKDGDQLEQGEEIGRLEGRAVSILQGERVALNFLQRMSGIASQTRRYVEAIGNNRARLLDTRKTTPLLRRLEKYAVKVGGGYNHRWGLFDMILIKENHIRSAGSISRAVALIREQDSSHKIEVEVTGMKELSEAFAAGVERVMLDNMSLEEMREAVKKYRGKVELEASGNVTLSRIGAIAATGVDFISCGSLTHSYKSLDLSLLFEEREDYE